MSKVIKLNRKSVNNNRVFKVFSYNSFALNGGTKKLGTLEYKSRGQKNLFLDVNGFLYDFLKGSSMSDRLLKTVKHSGFLKSPWLGNS